MNLPELVPPARDDVQSFFFPLFWGVADPDAFTAQMRAALGHVSISLHCADNFVTWGRNNSMLSDAAFVAAWQANAESDADKAIVWRRYILACAGYHCVQLDGDFGSTCRRGSRGDEGNRQQTSRELSGARHSRASLQR